VIQQGQSVCSLVGVSPGAPQTPSLAGVSAAEGGSRRACNPAERLVVLHSTPNSAGVSLPTASPANRISGRGCWSRRFGGPPTRRHDRTLGRRCSDAVWNEQSLQRHGREGHAPPLGGASPDEREIAGEDADQQVGLADAMQLGNGADDRRQDADPDLLLPPSRRRRRVGQHKTGQEERGVDERGAEQPCYPRRPRHPGEGEQPVQHARERERQGQLRARPEITVSSRGPPRCCPRPHCARGRTRHRG
jgi:hypothetical protein